MNSVYTTVKSGTTVVELGVRGLELLVPSFPVEVTEIPPQFKNH